MVATAPNDSLFPLTEIDWNNLERLSTCLDPTKTSQASLALLEKEWVEVVPSQNLSEVPREALDDFFARSLPAILAVMETDEGESRWWPRLCDYFDETIEFREQFRPYMYRRVSRQQLKRFKAAFDVWDTCVADEERDSPLGRFFESYRLDLTARLASTWGERERLFWDAAQACVSDSVSVDDALYPALQRRRLVLESHALRIAAFSLLNRNPADLGPVEDSFRAAVSRARDAQEVWDSMYDVHPDYLNFWAEVARLRKAEVAGQLDEARDAHQKATIHLSGLADSDSLFAEPNLWWNGADFGRELKIIDTLDALSKGPAGLDSAVEILTRWLRESEAELAGTLRLIRMRLRLQALQILLSVKKGEDVSRRILGLYEELGKYAAAGRHTWEIATQVELAVSGQKSLADVVQVVARLFAVDAQGPAGAAVAPRVPWRLLPHWYETTFRRYRVQGDAGSATVVLLWYGRTIADYIWQIYVKDLREQGAQVPGKRPDFMLASLSEVATVLNGLRRALCWSGRPGEALQVLCTLMTEALTAPADNVASEIVPAAIAGTASYLYPLPLLAQDVDSFGPDVLAARRFDGGERELRLCIVSQRPRKGTFFYIKPRFKQSEGWVKQTETINVWPAVAFGEPRPVALICEGITDQAVLETILDHMDSCWRELGIKIIPAEGDTAPARYAALESDRPIVLADHDKSYDLAGKRWKRMWEKCCYSFILKPDLERIDWVAFANALSDYWRIQVTSDELRVIGSQATTGKDFQTKLLARFQRPSFKSALFGRTLGHKLVAGGVPSILSQVAACALQLANGRRVSCRIAQGTPFHHCIG
jgi:hypothetical protein